MSHSSAMFPPTSRKSPQTPLLSDGSGAPPHVGYPPQQPQLSVWPCMTRRTKSLLQLAIAATLVTTCIAQLRSLNGHSPAAVSLHHDTANVLHLSQQVELPVTTPLAVAPNRFGNVEEHDEPQSREADAVSEPPPAAADDLLSDFTTNLTPLARTKAVSYAAPWVYARDPAQLPACERILLFQFMPWWGFASEYILYARAAAAADKLGYTFLEDDRNWNYGRLRNYFRPRKLSCVPPTDWTDQRLAVPLSLESARARPDRLVYSRLHLSNLDDWTRDAYLSARGVQDALLALKARDDEHRRAADRWILEEGGTLPFPLEEIFEDQSLAVQRMWALNKEVEVQVGQVKRRSGLARRKWFAGEEDAPEGETGDEKRGPVIALHVRLGDKAVEYEHDSQEMGITNSFGNLTVYVEATHDAYRRLLPSRYPALSSASTPRFSPYARPSILLITAEPDVPARLRSSTPLSRPFVVVQTPEPAVQAPAAADETRVRLAKQAGAVAAGDEAERPKAYGGARRKKAGTHGQAKAAKDRNRRLIRRDGQAQEAPETVPPPDLSAGYTQAAFNALPILERVIHTQAFVRDLTVLAREADAAVVSGASNIGRLAMLIAGKDAITGPRDAQGHGLGGRIRSVDAHFYPTAYIAAMYTAVADVEDLENAAFVPKEQYEAEQAALAAHARQARVNKGKKAPR